MISICVGGGAINGAAVCYHSAASAAAAGVIPHDLTQESNYHIPC